MAMMWKVNQYFVTYWNFADTTLTLLKFSLKKQKKKKKKANKKKQIQKQKNTFHTYLLGRKPSKEKFLQQKGKKSNKFSFFNVPRTHLYLTFFFFFLFKLKSERKSTWKVFLLLSHTLVWYSWRDMIVQTCNIFIMIVHRCTRWNPGYS